MLSIAHAQLAASASITSDFRYRGASIGSDQPAGTLSLSYDAPVSHKVDGYIGGVGTVGLLPGHGLQLLDQTEYAGLDGKAFRDAIWDVGVSNAFLEFYNGAIDRQFDTEIYAGIKTSFLSSYVHYSPHYFFDGVGALYAEVNASVRPAEGWRLFLHAGVLTPFAGGIPYYPTREQYDARVGITTLIGNTEIGLAWTFQRPGYAVPSRGGPNPDALVVTATRSF